MEPMFQVVWKPIQTEAADLFDFIETFNFDQREYIRLLKMFNEARTETNIKQGRHLLQRVACDWLNHKCQKHGLDHFSLNQSAPKQSWHQNFPVRKRTQNHLYIGRIHTINILRGGFKSLDKRISYASHTQKKLFLFLRE